MQVESIDEAVTVGAVFDGPNVRPKWFLWGNSKHSIEKVNMVWRSRQGEAPLLFFSVSSSSNTYELRLNQKTLEWRLLKVVIGE